MPEILRNKVFRGTALVIVAYGASQAMRLGGNLVLTRLLVPEFFGIMALAQVLISGLHLVSDIGLGPSIIRSPRGNDPVFLNTAWTLGVTRGIALWLLTLALAIPMAKIYENPDLSWVIPITGLNAILYGFKSTSIFTLNKDIQLGKLSIMEISCQLIALICMIILAYLYKNIWALVFGSLIGSLSTTVWSHFLDTKTKNYFVLDKDSITELYLFGKWVFVSTAMMFMATQADRFLLGKFFPLAIFGVYNIAVIFAELPKQVISQLSAKVIFPLITKFSHLPRNELRQGILRKRQLILFPMAVLVAMLTGFGDVLIDFLYDPRYKQAGWMLSLLAFGMWPLVLYSTIDRSLYAIGKPTYSAVGNFFKFLYMIICVPLSYKLGGIFGAVLAVALNDFPVYLVTTIGLNKENLSCFKQDVFATIFLVFVMTICIAIRAMFNLSIPGMTIF